MSERYDCTDPSGRAEGVPAAVGAIRRGEVIVLPTDTVYGIGCDAFDATAVASVLAAKGRGRDMPPPVLIPTARTAQGLATAVPDYAQRLMEKFWPGPLTVVLKAQTSLHWDLGDTNGTVALRVPDHDLTLELLGDVGPMAVTSANTTGDPAARTVDEARAMLGESVSVYLDAGPSGEGEPSTIIDCTGEAPVTLRIGAIAQADIDAALLPPDDVVVGSDDVVVGTDDAVDVTEGDASSTDSAEPSAEVSADVSEPSTGEPTFGEWHDVTEPETQTETQTDTLEAPVETQTEPHPVVETVTNPVTSPVVDPVADEPTADTLGEWHDVSTDERRTDGATPTQ